MFKKITKGLQAYRLWVRTYDLAQKWSSNMGKQFVNGVEVKSPWLSKINWTQAIGLLASILAFAGIIVPPELQEQAGIAITAITAVVTIIFRTWGNNTVTKAVQ